MTLSSLPMAGETEMISRTLVAEPATARALAPFGILIGGAPGEAARLSNFYDQAVLVENKPFHSTLPVEMSLCTIEPRGFDVRWLERHFQHTQAFLPLGGKPFCMVLAPSSEDELPDPESVRAFLFDGFAGFMIHEGVWHEFPFALQPATQIAVLLTAEATQGLAQENIIAGEGYSSDLEKKDVRRRLGIQWTVELS